MLCFLGLCDDTLFDTRYSWTQTLVNGRHSFRGFKDTMFQFDKENTQWRMNLYSTQNTFAITNGTEYPFGLRVWEVQGDPCYQHEGNTVSLDFDCCYAKPTPYFAEYFN